MPVFVKKQMNTSGAMGDANIGVEIAHMFRAARTSFANLSVARFPFVHGMENLVACFIAMSNSERTI